MYESPRLDIRSEAFACALRGRRVLGAFSLCRGAPLLQRPIVCPVRLNEGA
ncbi:hypothetical protein NDU88_003143, partial [Pleurodeles waltl]